VIVTLLYLPFGKLFHIFQRPAQIGVSFYKDAGARGEQATCRRCRQSYASAMMVRDLTTVERQLGFAYEMDQSQGADHYQQICPRCRRALFGLAPGRAWREHLPARASCPSRCNRGTDSRRPVEDHRALRTALLRHDRCQALDERGAGAARQDALLLLRAAMWHSAQGAR